MMKVVLLLLTVNLTVMIRCSAAEETSAVPAGKLININLSIMIIIINGGTFSFLSAHKESIF